MSSAPVKELRRKAASQKSGVFYTDHHALLQDVHYIIYKVSLD